MQVIVMMNGQRVTEEMLSSCRLMDQGIDAIVLSEMRHG